MAFDVAIERRGSGQESWGWLCHLFWLSIFWLSIFWLSIFLAVCLNGVPKAAETIPHDL